ncbi:SET domain-containing protein-lysine N-methyltransferase [Mesorhizobium sp. M8A.F.Ca.ET.165.01.1.1]|uniref:SET domain-containing protein-lysine N-methyltransferase n=1 Tax=Mesorhizobium sp. M8A.F.Ca.ET.165.01.1.1 TaxID=2563960 RepID=UPI001093DF26|nr:SET domain-containing protein-lysine N-methyltransferase [Mesorhizobium sp. M8A.F.Ca.ET.165.01.1.1]TGT35774.1 SET domain-containing protein [Mesorhizobium sp. M8A.F.Ca.ET.165.01.1.1]
MPRPKIDKYRVKTTSIMLDDVGCARQLNDHNVRVLNVSEDKGRGVFSARDFMPGEVVVIGLIARLEAARTTDSIQLDWGVHALFEEPAVIINHSCDPNLAIVPNRFGAYDFMAIREIFSGVELTWDYATSEFACVGVSVCLCGAENCRGAAGGFATLPRDHPMVISGLYAPYLKEKRGNPRGDDKGIFNFAGA